MTIFNFPQRSEEWYKIRIGKITGSDFHTLMGNGETKKKLLLKKAVERITGKPQGDELKNSDIQRGVDLEDTARTYYEMETGNTVNQVGFIQLNEYVGCSPDGLIGMDGILEIKCPRATTFLSHYLDDSIEKQYYTQIQFNMMITGAKWCDFVRYNEDFPLYIKRVKADKEYQCRIRERLDECIKEIEEIVNNYKERGKNADTSRND